MPTIVSIELGGTGANTAAGARAALGAASAVDSNSSYGQANAAYTQANNAYSQANSAYAAANNAVLKAGDTVTGNLSVAATIISQNIVPNLNVTYNLGSSDKRFKDLYLSNSTIYLGDSTITADGNKLIVPAIETSSGINLESQLAASYSQANAAYTQANSAYTQANAAYSQANSGYTQANNAYSQANSAYGQANSAYGAANTAQTTAQDAYNQANTATTNAGNAYSQANAAYLQANTAFTAANNSNLKLGGVISGSLNVTNDIIVGGNVYLQGNTTFINVATYQINDSLMYVAANNTLTDSVDIGFVGGKNTSGTFSHTGLARDATDGKYKLFDSLADSGHVGNVIDFANTTVATLVANIEASSMLLSGNAVATNVSVNAAYSQANSAYSAANNRVLKAGDTMTGTLNISAGGLVVWASSGTSQVNAVEVKNLTNNGYLSVSAAGNASDVATWSNGSMILEGVPASTGDTILSSFSGRLLFQTSNRSNRLVIDSSGNVGIGTTSTSQKLHVSGGIITNNFWSDSSGLCYWGTYPTAYGVLTWDTGYGRIHPSSTNNLYIGGVGTGITVTSNNNIGIGTSSPIDKLDVRGGSFFFNRGTGSLGDRYIYINKGANNDGGILLTRDNVLDWQIVNNVTNGDLGFYSYGASSQVFYIKRADGNIGIGTTSPNHLVHAYANSNSRSKIKIENASSGSNARAELVVNAYGNSWGLGIGATANNSNAFYINEDSNSTDTTRFTILTGGNVGIGTTSPATKLHVEGDILLDVANIGSERGIFFREGFTSSDKYNVSILAYDHNGNFPDGLSINGYDGISFCTGSNSRNERMRLDVNGNLGIGTTNPSAKLDIEGSGAGGLLHINNTTAGKSGMVFQDNGTQKLIIGLAGIWEGNSSTDAAIATESGSNIRFYTNGSATERMRINTSGNVGIGTTNPSAKLQVDGNVETTWGFYRFAAIYDNTYRMGMYFNANGRTLQLFSTSGDSAGDISFSTRRAAGSSDSDYGTERVRILSNGNVGIGTGSPDVKLEVDGHVSIRGSSNLYWGQSTSSVGSWTTKQYASGNTHYFNAQSFNFTNEGYGSDTFAVITTSGIRPGVDNTKDLGTASFRWANLYTGDLHLSNKGKQNDVDGTWGEWTIQEGEENLYVINRRTGKKFKIKMEEV